MEETNDESNKPGRGPLPEEALQLADVSDNASRLWRPAFLCLMLIVIEVYILFYDVDSYSNYTTQQKRGSKVVAHYLEGLNSVRKKASGTISWNEPDSKEVFYQRDSLLTLGQSSALVEFLDGSSMQIEENSLIVFEENKLNLLEGTIERKLAGTDPLTILVAGNTIRDPSGKAKFRIRKPSSQPGAGVAISVSEGELQVDTQQGVPKTISKNQEVEIKDSEIRIDSLKVQIDILEKPYHTRHETDDAIDLQINIESSKIKSEGEAKIKLEIYKAGEPEVLAAEKEIELSVVETSQHSTRIEDLDDGEYSVGSSLQFGQTNFTSKRATMRIKTLATPKVDGPTNGLRIKRGNPVTFRWKNIDAEIKIQISELTDFSETTEVSGSGEKAVWTTKKPGTYYWRALATYPEAGTSAPTASGKFVIEEKTPLRAPKLRSPEIRFFKAPLKPSIKKRSSLDFTLFNEAQAASSANSSKQRAEITLAWEKIENALAYRVQISNDRDFKSLIVDYKSTSTSLRYVHSLEQSGNIFYRVAAIDEEGSLGIFSDAREIEIQTPEAESGESPDTQLGQLGRKKKKWAIDLGIGIATHRREFKSEANPLTSEGSGFIPAFGSLGFSRRLSQKTSSLFIGKLWLLAEKAEPTTPGVQVETYGVPLLRAWLGVEWNLSRTLRFSLGPYAATSNSFTWNGRKAKVSREILLGGYAQLSSASKFSRGLRWSVQIAPTAVGSTGLDIGGDLSYSFNGHGFYFGAEPIFRFSKLENYSGGLLKAGYEF